MAVRPSAHHNIIRSDAMTILGLLNFGPFVYERND